MTKQVNQSGVDSFYGLGIAPSLLESLDKLNFKTPTQIQAQAIPVAVSGKDIIGIAQTGTGKTMAFGIPMIQRLAQDKKVGLVVVPTRELAMQVDEVLLKIGKTFGLKTAVFIGGTPPGPQLRALARNPHVVIATPGRLIDHLEQKNIRLNNVGVVVLDEADRMLDMGFLPQIKKILQELPTEKQMMLFSATMSPEIMNIASSYMKLPTPIEIARAGTTADKITQELFIVSRDQKNPLLQTVLEQYRGSTIVFTRTKYGAKKVAAYVRSLDVGGAVEIHSNRSLTQRREALQGFKTGKYRVLVATDIASRGIDVAGIELVINFDLPQTADDYVHRIGRTARASAKGHAITFAMPSERRDILLIERLIRKSLPVSKLPDLPASKNLIIAEEKRQQQSLDRPYRKKLIGHPRKNRFRSGSGSRGGSRNFR